MYIFEGEGEVKLVAAADAGCLSALHALVVAFCITVTTQTSTQTNHHDVSATMSAGSGKKATSTNLAERSDRGI